MRTEKYQISQVAKVLSESDRSMYENHDGQYDKVSRSLIDFERTPYNYNLSENNMTYSDVKSLNEKWRGCKVAADDITLFGTVVTLPRDMLPPEMQKLTGKELFDAIHENPEVEKEVNKFFKEAYDGLKKIYGLEKEDICSAWVHMDETTPHLHFYAIPHVRLQEKTEDISVDKEKPIDAEKDRLYHLSEEDPKAFYEEIKRGYIEQIQKYEEDLLKTTAPTKKASLERKKSNTQSNLDKMLALSPEAYAKRKHSRYASELGYTKRKKARTDTVSYETVVPLYVYKTQHKDLQEYVSQRLGYEVHILNGKTRDIDFSKLTAEQKEAGLRIEQNQRDARTWIKAQVEKMDVLDEQIAEKEAKNAAYDAFIQKNHSYKDYDPVFMKKGYYAVPEQDIDIFCAAADDVKQKDKELQGKDEEIKTLKKDKERERNGRASAERARDRYKGYKEEKEQMIADFQKRLNKVKKSPFKDPSEMSGLIHEYIAINTLSDKERAAILKACEALDKLDRYIDKLEDRLPSFTLLDDDADRLSLTITALNKQLKNEYMKILDYGGRAEMYDDISALWESSKSVSTEIYKKYGKKASSVQSLQATYTPIITGILSDLLSLVRMAFEMIQEAQYGYGR